MSTPTKRDAVVGDTKLLEQAHKRNAAAPAAEEGGGVIEDAAEVLGLEEYTWNAPDGYCSLTFRRPPGGTSMKIARLLGPSQANNQVLQRYYRALASIVSFNGERVPECRTDAAFRGLMQRFGADGYYDDNFETYCTAWDFAMNPEMIEAIFEAEGMGLAPDDFARICKNAGLSHTKKSPRRSTSANS